jgi:TolB-like protein/transcriptional regulator with XRE-family HTH domain
MRLLFVAPGPESVKIGRAGTGIRGAVTPAGEGDDFPARLSLALNALNLSRTQVSALLGVNKSLVSRWLSGEMKPSGYNLARLSAEIAKRKPGFNMNAWTAPDADFRAALDLARSIGAGETSGAPVAASRSQSRRFPNWGLAAAAAALILALAAAGWLVRSQRQAGAGPAIAPAAITSVAVMPFVNMSGDPAKEYLGDGISEEIINDLANTPNLRVAARTSSFSFKGKPADIGEISLKLNVGAVLEGSVRQEGARVRIVAQLIDAKSGFHLWSARYDRKLVDILGVQDEIARGIARTLGQKLAPRHVRRRKIDPVAYQKYLEAQYIFNQRNASSMRRARDLAGEAIARQPDFADAYALRGHALMLIEGGQAESERMVLRALKLDPVNRQALDIHLQLAMNSADWKAFYEDAHRLMAVGKHDALYYNGIGFFYQYMGFPMTALEARKQSAEREPLQFAYRHNFELASWHAGRLGDALAAGKAALELQPDHMIVLSELCALAAQTGDMPAAREYLRRLSTMPAPHITWRNYPRTCGIEIALAEKNAPRLKTLLDRFDKKNWHLSDVGMLYARAGELSEALPYFARAYDAGELPALIYARYDAKTPKALLKEPGWNALWRRPELREWRRYHDRIAREAGGRLR